MQVILVMHCYINNLGINRKDMYTYVCAHYKKIKLKYECFIKIVKYFLLPAFLSPKKINLACNLNNYKYNILYIEERSLL